MAHQRNSGTEFRQSLKERRFSIAVLPFSGNDYKSPVLEGEAAAKVAACYIPHLAFASS
jgi:hypothetical protein